MTTRNFLVETKNRIDLPKLTVFRTGTALEAQSPQTANQTTERPHPDTGTGGDLDTQSPDPGSWCPSRDKVVSPLTHTTVPTPQKPPGRFVVEESSRDRSRVFTNKRRTPETSCVPYRDPVSVHHC